MERHEDATFVLGPTERSQIVAKSLRSLVFLKLLKNLHYTKSLGISAYGNPLFWGFMYRYQIFSLICTEILNYQFSSMRNPQVWGIFTDSSLLPNMPGVFQSMKLYVVESNANYWWCSSMLMFSCSDGVHGFAVLIYWCPFSGFGVFKHFDYRVSRWRGEVCVAERTYPSNI